MTIRDLRIRAKDCLFEFDRKIVAQILATLSAAASAARAAAEQVAETAHAEQIAQNVFKARKGVRIETTKPASSSAHRRMAIAIISRALVGICQHGVGFAALLEALFGLGIVGIAVRVVLHGELAIGSLDLLLIRGACHAQNFVVIAFCVGGQSSWSLDEVECGG